ncbi:MAG TPA: phosphoglyceromutase, partial [Algoriphagus sp.]|uniref:sulfatase-like hydrolase/transferase n=1 Tax=Algoriphagus sp. TaxID=1872435 RepID=UPI000EE9AA8E
SVNAGFDQAEGEHLSDKEELLNRLQTEIIGPWTEVRLDAFTHHFAMEALKNQRPRALYIAYGETDDWAHENHYDRYLWAARQTDDYIKEIWEWVQSDPEYRDNTILIITSDHGRGVRKDTWLGHGSSIPESSETWIALLGAGVSPRGEISEKGQWYNAQIARTIFEMLGFEYPDEKAAKPLKLTSKN